MTLSGTITNNFQTGYYIQLEWSATQNIEKNESYVTSRLYIGGDYNINNSINTTMKIVSNGVAFTSSTNASKSSGQKKLLASVTNHTVKHNADGTKTIAMGGSVELRATLSGTYWGTVSLTTTNFALNTIPRASDFSVSNFIIGNDIPITITRASSSFTHNFSMYKGSTFIGEWLTKVATSTTLVLNETHQNRIYQTIPANVTVSIDITCHTYNGSTLIGSKSKRVVATVGSSIVPTFTAVTHSENVSDVNTKVGKYVQGLSKLNLAITGATGTKYSTIKSYQITFEGTNYNTSSATSAYVKGSGSLTVTGKITDSRGRTATKSVTVSVLAYEPPKVTTLTLQRCNSDGSLNALGTYVKVTRTGTVKSLINSTEKNTLTYRIKTRPRLGGSWTVKKESTISGLSLTGSEVIGTYPATASYEVLLEIQDKFRTATHTTILTVGQVTLSWGKSGIGVGKIWEQGGLDLLGSLVSSDAPQRIITAHGYIDLGPANASWCHFGTDRDKYYFSKPVYVNGQIYAGSAYNKLVYNAGNSWVIVEHGSNDNGRYLRFSDGTQFCWGEKNIKTSSSPGAYISATVTFPAVFSSFENAVTTNWAGSVATPREK